MLTDYITGKDYKSAKDLWFNQPENQAHMNVICTIQLLDTQDQPRQQQMLKAAKLYDQQSYSCLYSAMISRMDGPEIYKDDFRNTWNVAKSCADTLAAKISKNKIKAQVVTDQADFALQQQSKKLDAAIYGIMHSENFHITAKRAFLDMLIFGTGIIETIAGFQKVSYERVFPWEVFVDHLEAQYGKPQNMYRYRFVSKQILQKAYPNNKFVENVNIISNISRMPTSPTILVFEAWHLPEEDQPGRHVICTEAGNLVDEDYTFGDFPFTMMKYSEPCVGYWGNSLISEIAPSQIEINKVLYFVQQAIQLGHAPKWLVKQGSIPKNYMNNKIGSILPVNGEYPQFIAPTPINQQVIDYLQLITNKVYEIAGISQLSAASKKPAGLDSGKALQTFNDIESSRFVLTGQVYEQFFVDAFRKTIFAAKTVAKDYPKFEVLTQGNAGTTKLKWREVDLDANKFCVKAFPVSTLPSHPEARYQRLSEMMQSGMISPEEFAELSEMPDIQAYNSIKFAPYFSAKAQIESIIEKQEYKAPEKYDDLELCMKMAINYYLRLRDQDAPENTLESLRNYIDEIQSMIEASTPPPAAPQELPMGMAPAQAQVPM